MERRILRRVLFAGVFLVVATAIIVALRAEASAHACDLFERYVLAPPSLGCRHRSLRPR